MATKKMDNWNDMDDLLTAIRDAQQENPRRNRVRRNAEAAKARRFLTCMAGVLVLLLGIVIGGLV